MFTGQGLRCLECSDISDPYDCSRITTCGSSEVFHYCKLGNLRESFIFANNVKRHICDVKYSQLGHNLTISINDRVISPLHGGFVFTKLRICEVSRKLNPRENFRNSKSMRAVSFFMLLLSSVECCQKRSVKNVSRFGSRVGPTCSRS